MATKTNNREMSYTKVSASIVKETEKAYQVEVLYWTKFDNPVKKATMWSPKSCTKTEDGKVTEIATFILNRWMEEHRNVIRNHSNYAADKMRIEWDIEYKERLMKKDAEEKAASRKHFDEVVAYYLPLATEASHKMMGILGMFAKTFGRIWKEEGTDAATCDEFIAWGTKVCKKYGQPHSDEEAYTSLKNADEKARGFSVEYGWDVWVLGDFRVDPYGTKQEREFYDLQVKEYIIQRYFKKETQIKKEFCDWIEKFYTLNGNRY